MQTIQYRKVDVKGLKVFVREAGPADAPTLLLLHGFPTSSHMFRGLIPLLADRFHIVAPDLPGFGQSDMPSRDVFTYTFDNIARVIEELTEVMGLPRYAIYVFDYGAPTGFRLAVRHPERITAIISQNGNAYEEGLSEGWAPIQAYWKDSSKANREALRNFLAPQSTIWQYTHGVPDTSRVSPDGYSLDNFYLARPGADEAQLDLLGDYKSNVALYPLSRNTSGRTSRRSWRCGARMIPSSCRQALRLSSATFPMRPCGFSTPVTLRSRRMPMRSHHQSGTSSHAESVATASAKTSTTRAGAVIMGV